LSRRIYLASSWRNPNQPGLVQVLRRTGHKVYDFRNPQPGNEGFSWREIDPCWQNWTPAEYVRGLQHPTAQQGLALDFNAMKWADTVVMLQPCGRSAALELGWAIGAGKATAVLLSDGAEPELMLGLADILVTTELELLAWLRSPRPEGSPVTPRVDTKGSRAEEAGCRDDAAFRPFAVPVATPPAEDRNVAGPDVTAGETAPDSDLLAALKASVMRRGRR